MLPGKVPPEILQNIVFSKLGRKDSDVLLGPELGEDAAVIKVGSQVLIAATDPITGSIEDVGWLAVHVNANDIATFGVAPRWFLASILLPIGHTQEQLAEIMHQIDAAATELDVAVTGGHSEITESIAQPIVVGFMMGVAPAGKYVTSSGAQSGDALIMTKTTAIEGTSILATEGSRYLTPKIGEELVMEGQTLRKQISVVKDGIIAFQTGHIHAMHDPTEGGLSNGIHEICDASGVGIEIDAEKIPIANVTRQICAQLEINPHNLISSGSMLISCESDYATKVIRKLSDARVAATQIGTFISDASHRKIREGHSLRNLERPESDALWSALKRIKSS
jgi:hydrogenase maturation factor